MGEQVAVVVGLLPSQARTVAEHFPGVGLKFIPRDREREVPTLINGFEHVLVMTKFISHATWRQVPRERLTPINGGVTDLRRALNRLLPKLKAAAADSSKRRQGDQAVVPSQIDYSPLRNGKPGSKGVIVKPEGIEQAAFEKQVSAMRSYYKRNHGIESEAQVVEGGIEVTVNGTRGVPAKPERQRPKSVHKDMWWEAYLRLAAALPGVGPEHIAERADAALAAYRQRFPD